MTSDAMINPATDGTNALEPGIARRSVHLCFAPGGQMQCARQLIDISSIGVTGCSLEYTTFSFFTPRFFELAAHNLRQRADRCLIDVRHLKHCRIQLIAGAHAADDRRCLSPCACMTSAIFGRHGIDCVHDVRIARQIRTSSASSPAERSTCAPPPYSPG